jgi:hypothetical protein
MTAPPQVDKAVATLVSDLEQNLHTTVLRATTLVLDGSVTSLAFVDHYLGLVRGESREPIVELVAASAGAYFGELVRREYGAIWAGRADDPRGLRLLMTPHFLHFSPVSLAWAAILGRDPDDDDLDTAFHLDTRRGDDPAAPSDADFILEHLQSVAPIPEDQFYTLTARFETLGLILGLLSERRAMAGSDPHTYTLADYYHVLS